MEIIKNSEKLPFLAVEAKRRLSDKDFATLVYLLRCKDGTKKVISIRNDAILYHATNSPTAHSRVENAMNRFCQDLGIEPPAFASENRTTLVSVTGRAALYLFNNPNIDYAAAVDAVAAEIYILNGVLLEEAMELGSEACNLALEHIRSRHIDGIDPVTVDGDIKDRFKEISQKVLSGEMVCIGGESGHSGVETDDPQAELECDIPESKLERLLHEYTDCHRITEEIINYMRGDIDNLSDDTWETLERPELKEFVEKLGGLLYAPDMDTTALRKLELVLDTADIRLVRAQRSSPAFIRDGKVFTPRW